MDQLRQITELLLITIYFVLSFWWLVLPVLLCFILMASFESFKRMNFLANMKWVSLQLSVPRETRKSPKATEQIFAALHTVASKVKPKDKFWKGKVGDWFSFEIVSIGGDINFIIRVLEANRNLLESQIYAQYPDAEIFEVDDYMADYPDVMPDEQYDATGGELILTKSDAYPIRTYPEFEEEHAGKDDLKRLDPLASLSQSMAILQPGEIMAVQVLVKSTDDKWAKDAQAEVDKLMGKKSKIKHGAIASTIIGIDKFIFHPISGEIKKDDKDATMASIQFGKQEQIKAIDRSTAKLGFSTNIRFIYFAERAKFNKGRVAGVTGAFKQLSSQNLNGFKVDGDTKPDGKWPIKEWMEFRRKKKLYKKFKRRQFAAKSYVLNTEELATIYHFPDIGIESPLPRIEAKKGEPPANLPIA